MAVILTSVIKSEPLDQSDGSDYTRNCEPWYSVFSLFYFITSFFLLHFYCLHIIFLPLMHCVFAQIFFSFTSKNHKKYSLLLVACFLFYHQYLFSCYFYHFCLFIILISCILFLVILFFIIF